MTDSLKGLRKMADWYRPRIFDRDEAVGVDERPDVPSQYREKFNMERFGWMAKRRTLNRRETDEGMRRREQNARQREKNR